MMWTNTPFVVLATVSLLLVALGHASPARNKHRATESSAAGVRPGDLHKSRQDAADLPVHSTTDEVDEPVEPMASYRYEAPQGLQGDYRTAEGLAKEGMESGGRRRRSVRTRHIRSHSDDIDQELEDDVARLLEHSQVVVNHGHQEKRRRRPKVDPTFLMMGIGRK